MRLHDHDGYDVQAGEDYQAAPYRILAPGSDPTGTPSTCPRPSGKRSPTFYRAAPANYYAQFWRDHSLSRLA